MLPFVKEVSVFVICAQMLLHFKAAKHYGKYMKLLIGIMVLAKLCEPVAAFWGNGEDADLIQKLEGYQAWFLETGNAEEEYGMKGVEDIEAMRLEEIKSILNNMEAEENEDTAAWEPEEIAEETVEEIQIERIEVGAGV